jgi:hypothetical protein
MHARQRRRTRGKIAAAVFQLCCAGGLVLGLLDGLQAPPAEPPQCSTEPCVADSFVAGLKPVLVPVSVGLALGAAVGLAIALAIKKADFSSRSRN